MLASVILLRQLVGAKGNVESPAHRAVELANAEVCLPTALPAERATTLGALADHYDGDAAMADKLTIVTLAAYNKLACAEHEQALQLFRRVVEADADDVCSWYGIADCCRALELAREEAIALERLSALLLDPREAAAASKRAASLYLDVLAEDELGLRFLARAVELDIEDFETFDRWFRHVRKQGDSERVIDLCTARLAVADDPKELTRLHWERARAFRRLGGLEEALTDLDNVRLLDPQHVGARALGSEIFIHLRNYAQAADELAQLAAMPHAPPEQRHMSALAAVDLYDSHLADVDAVLNVLRSMANAPGDGMAVKERVAKSVARAGRWEEAVALLGELAVERKTSAGRAEAARLRLAILRDEIRSPVQLSETVQVLLRNSPADAEALDLILDGALDETTSAALLFEHLPHLLRETAERLQPESAARLARAAEHLNRSDVRLLALASLACLGTASEGALAELRSLQQLCPSHPLTALDGASLEALVDPDDSGPLLQIMRELAPHLPEVIGPTLHSLGFGRRERKRALDRADVRAEVAAWKRALLLEHEPEMFIGGADPERIDVFAEGKHGSLVLGLDVRAPLEPAQRGALASAVFSLRHGTSVALSRGPVEVAALLASAVRITGASVPGPAFALAPEFERLLSRELPRRVRRAIEPLAAQASAQQQDPLHYAHAALATLDRVAAIAAGEFFVVPTPLEEEALQRQRRLLAFCLSPTYLAIRRQLGMNPQ